MNNTDETTLTDEQQDNMLHALGRSHGTVGGRNYYWAGEPNPSWDDLVKKGFAERRDCRGANSRMVTIYHVSLAGIRELGYDPDITVNPVKVKK